MSFSCHIAGGNNTRKIVKEPTRWTCAKCALPQHGYSCPDCGERRPVVKRCPW